MQSEGEARNSFLQDEEFQENNEHNEELDASQSREKPGEPWIEGAEELRTPPNVPTEDPADTGQPAASRSPGRPTFRRDQWAPAPQHAPPPVPSEAAPEDGDVPTDSLSLAQLRRIVQEMPKKEATPYAFEYQDKSSFEDEVEELFDYSAEERVFFRHISSTFDRVWRQWQQASSEGSDNTAEDGVSWVDATSSRRSAFLEHLNQDITGLSSAKVEHAIAALAYIVLGCWKDSAKRSYGDNADDLDPPRATHDNSVSNSSGQLSEMKANILLVADNIGIDPVFEATKSACSQALNHDATGDGASNDMQPSTAVYFVPRCCTTVMYLLVDYAQRTAEDQGNASVVRQCQKTGPRLLDYLTGLLANMRWNESAVLPLMKILPLFWKTILMVFGGTQEAHTIRDIVNEADKSKDDEQLPLITASPLDYHLFRQEITSKYPAFDPPKPLFPFEADTTSMVPPLQDHSRAETSSDGIGPASVNGSGSSIFHQPVHIATPAPSPPPSPAGPGGKGIKKQNYQTNQLFPFLYPPLDDSSNSIGGKGGTELQDLLVGRKWEGKDIPTSILEAADIFSTRMRASRAMKQLWDERVRFIKYERGYLTSPSDTNDEVDGSENEPTAGKQPQNRKVANSLLEQLSANQRRRLVAVENYYRSQLPFMQSVIIVLLKVLLQTVTTLVTQPDAPNGLQTGFESPEQHPQDKQVDGHGNDGQTASDGISVDNINTIRTQEILGKAVSGSLLLLLKWFKLSHILKFEYLTQLLLDSNYIQLILKLFTHQELERAVNTKCEKQNLNFFTWCRRDANSNNNSPQPDTASSPREHDSDDAVPPAIPRSNTVQPIDVEVRPQRSTSSPPLTAQPPPEVDELGYATSSPPQAPITNYSWRTFFTTINHLRILQKIVKSKPHRQLLMVQYKYSNILKKSLKVPQPDVRLYTLKVIKGQVPYCHRKWRQSNMRIITAIYLHCKPELRDDWLAGLTMEEEMGEALPQEQALRSLTYWHNLRRYPEAMTEDKEKAKGLLEEEQDFFIRELEGIEAALGDAGREVEVDPPDPMADAGWTREEKEAYLARMRELAGAEGREGNWG